jgi:hypothetical protein
MDAMKRAKHLARLDPGMRRRRRRGFPWRLILESLGAGLYGRGAVADRAVAALRQDAQG